MPASPQETVRARARAARASQPDKDATSRVILARAMELPAYRAAKHVLFYVDVRDEVRTRPVIRQILTGAKPVAVPYCVGDHLHLFRLTDWEQLVPGYFGLLEPRLELRGRPENVFPPDQIDLVMTPGVAFDRQGARLGYGKGFYDRLLAEMPASTTFVGLAFESQVFASIETQPHDIAMHCVVTQSNVYYRRERRR